MATLVCLMALFGLGTCFALLGSISVKLMPRLSIDAAQFGSLVSGFMFAAMISSLVVGVLLDSLGFKLIAIVGFVAVTLVILLLARGTTYQSVMIASVLLGVAAMALNTAGNTMAPGVLTRLGFINDAAAASNLGNVFFGLGMFLTPTITSTLFKRTTYENSVSALAVLMGLGAVLAVLAVDYPVAQGSFTLGAAFALLANPVVLVAALLLFCYISLEVSLSNWLVPFGKEVVKAEGATRDEASIDATAARLLTLFAIAMMIGRLLSSFVPNLVGIGPWLLAGVAAITVGVLLAMVAAKNFGQAQIMAFLAGLLFAPIFPTTVGVTFSKVPPEVYGSTFGIIFAVGLLGATIIPKAIGNMATGSTVQRSLRLLIPACLVLVALAVALNFVG